MSINSNAKTECPVPHVCKKQYKRRGSSFNFFFFRNKGPSCKQYKNKGPRSKQYKERVQVHMHSKNITKLRDQFQMFITIIDATEGPVPYVFKTQTKNSGSISKRLLTAIQQQRVQLQVFIDSDAKTVGPVLNVFKKTKAEGPVPHV